MAQVALLSLLLLLPRANIREPQFLSLPDIPAEFQGSCDLTMALYADFLEDPCRAYL